MSLRLKTKEERREARLMFYKDDVFVSVNGENCVIKRGERVKIKRKFAEILDNSEHQDYETAQLIEQKSLTIPAAISDYDYVVITGSVVYNAGVNEKYRALAQEDILPHLILQVVVKAENAHTDWAQAIVDAYHSDEFKAYLEKENAADGAWKGLWWIPDELK